MHANLIHSLDAKIQNETIRLAHLSGYSLCVDHGEYKCHGESIPLELLKQFMHDARFSIMIDVHNNQQNK